MTMTVFLTRNTLVAISWITHKQGTTLLTLCTHGIVVAFSTLGQHARTLTVGMSIAETLYTAIAAHVTEITFTHLGTYTATFYASLITNWNTGSIMGCVAVTANASISHFHINAPFRHTIAIVMAIAALVLGWTFYIIPTHHHFILLASDMQMITVAPRMQ